MLTLENRKELAQFIDWATYEPDYRTEAHGEEEQEYGVVLNACAGWGNVVQ
jgi:hypothetical protein